MKITSKINKTRFELRLDKISCIYTNNSEEYYIMQNDKMIKIEEKLKESDLFKNFMFIPGRRLIPCGKNAPEDAQKFVDNKNKEWLFDNTKHFINKDKIEYFSLENQTNGQILLKVGIETISKNLKIVQDFYFLVSNNNFTQYIYYFE